MTLKNLNIDKKVDDFLEKLPPKQFKQVYTCILNLRKNCSPHDSSKLKGHENFYRVDSGEYRIIYSYDDAIVNIFLVGKRNGDEVYKRFKQLGL